MSELAVAGSQNGAQTVPASRRRSLWLQEALRDEMPDRGESLHERIVADVCIIGGGYTGLWTALRIKELHPETSVALLEADICGGAASGRNGGFVLSWWPKVETLIGRVGQTEGVRLAHASEEAVSGIGEFCLREEIDAHYVQGGWLWTATSPAQIDAWSGAIKCCDRYDVHPFRVLDREDVVSRTGSPANLGGVFEAGAATVQPALLARGLRRVALRRGVQIFEHSPMVDLDRARGIAKTPAGEIEANVMVLATNCWAARIPELRRAIVPLSSDMVATAPMPERLRESGWTGGESVSNSRMMVHYYRTTRDGRVAFGRAGGALGMAGRFGADFDYNAKRASSVVADLRRLVPASVGIPITNAWGGAVDRSVDGLPIFGRLRGHCPIYYGIGFSGNGVGPCYIAGRILASTALGIRDEWSESGLAAGVPAKFPPEPFRIVGGLLVREAVRRKETHEDRGASVDVMTKRLAALAPSGYFKVTPESDRGE